MDGTKYVSQCPVERGSSFTYKFQVRLILKLWQQSRASFVLISTVNGAVSADIL